MSSIQINRNKSMDSAVMYNKMVLNPSNEEGNTKLFESFEQDRDENHIPVKGPYLDNPFNNGISQYTLPTKVDYQFNTKNKSFIDMHIYLKSIGIRRNAFHLVLFDSDLKHIDPHDPNLNLMMKKKVLMECKRNFWYFAREVVRIPVEGSPIPVRYKLHRGNLALNFSFLHNFNIFLELPRQNFKTTSSEVWYLWCFLFATNNTSIMFMHKKHERSKANLTELKGLRECLPDYLKFETAVYVDEKGRKVKVPNNMTNITNPYNNNVINTMASARNESSADSLGRGCKMAIQWYDEFAFITFNDIIYAAATPAFTQASLQAKTNNAPYGILITTTPGDMRTACGKYAYGKMNNSTKFLESFYDMTPAQLYEIINANESSPFIYIKFSYKQLGRTEKWFRDIVILLEKNWNKIRREVLLEWADIADDSPFDREDLEAIKASIKEPISSIFLFNGKYQLDIYNKCDIVTYPPIIGVDVAGALYRDSSAITIIDSKSTNVIGTLNCNYIPSHELFQVLFEVVTKYMPNAVINIESNSIGASVIQLIMKSSIKRNLYFEIRDRIVEERLNNGVINHGKQRTKVYGTFNTANIRDTMFDILDNRVRNHKNKFFARILYDELAGLVLTPKGRIDHVEGAHDDQVLSYLLALYVYYNGQNIMENFGLQRRVILTDDNSEPYEIITNDESLLDNSVYEVVNNDMTDLINQQLDFLKGNGKIMTDADISRINREEDERVMREAMSRDPLFANLYKSAENYDPAKDIRYTKPGLVPLSDSLFNLDSDMDYMDRY